MHNNALASILRALDAVHNSKALPFAAFRVKLLPFLYTNALKDMHMPVVQ